LQFDMNVQAIMCGICFPMSSSRYEIRCDTELQYVDFLQLVVDAFCRFDGVEACSKMTRVVQIKLTLKIQTKTKCCHVV